MILNLGCLHRRWQGWMVFSLLFYDASSYELLHPLEPCSSRTARPPGTLKLILSVDLRVSIDPVSLSVDNHMI